MKRIFSIILVFVLLCSCISAYAASGDVIGNIYATDIRAYINGVLVPSYNIGGRTVVVIEDITDSYEYNDYLRTLLFWSLAPSDLNSGQNNTNKKPGTIVGRVYETDIATYIYDEKLPAYALNGKMAVAIEDLGADQEFSDIGGKYIWNPTERTISLEFMYWNDIYDILNEKHASLELTQKGDIVEAEFIPELFYFGSVSYKYEDASDSDKPFLEVFADGVFIGYCFKRPSLVFHVSDDGFYTLENNNHNIGFYYYYPDIVREVLKDFEILEPTREDRLQNYEDNLFEIIDSFETEEYTFLYMSQANSHGSSQYLRRIAADGTEICYDDEFESVSFWGNKAFENVVIDRENEKVYLHYDVDYVIDLKTGKMSVVE